MKSKRAGTIAPIRPCRTVRGQADDAIRPRPDGPGPGMPCSARLPRSSRWLWELWPGACAGASTHHAGDLARDRDPLRHGAGDRPRSPRAFPRRCPSGECSGRASHAHRFARSRAGGSTPHVRDRKVADRSHGILSLPGRRQDRDRDHGRYAGGSPGDGRRRYRRGRTGDDEGGGRLACGEIVTLPCCAAGAISHVAAAL